MRLFLLFLSSLIIIAVIVNFSSCARKAIPVPPLTLEEPVKVIRDDKNRYTLTFQEENEWTVFVGNNPAAIDWSNPFITVTGNEIAIPAFEKSKRVYFGVMDKDSATYIVSERKLALDGTPNFRDIGGLATADGNIVNWGNIYRSSNLADLEKDDLSYLNNLACKTVCDFRYTSEIEDDPNKLPDGVDYYKFPIGGEEGLFYQEIKRKVLKEGLRKKEAKKEFVNVMRLFADSAAQDFKPVMDLIADPDMKAIPLVYHCSGGKDRTGFMTMIILATLGVDKETIRNEYLMSNYYRYKKNKSIARKARIIGIDSETLRYILVVQNEYFDAVFDVVENKYGGLENYLLEKFAITPEIRQKMIKNYTVNPNELASENSGKKKSSNITK